MQVEFLWPKFDVIDVENTFFQQDGANCHAACETMQLLQITFQAVSFLDLAINTGHQDRVI